MLTLLFALVLPAAGHATSLPPLGGEPSARSSSTASATTASVPRAEAGADSVLVLPLTAPESEEPEWLSAGIAEFLSESLAAAGESVVDREDRDEVVEDSGLSDEKQLALASACVLGRAAGASRVVTGTWRSEGSALTVTARVVDVRRLKLVREGQAQGTFDALGPLLASLATQLVPAGATGRASIDQLGAVPQSALLPWMQAAAEPDMASQHLEAALKEKPDFAPALLALAEVRLDEGRPEEVARLVARLPPGAPAHRRAEASLLDGRARLAAGDNRGAVTALTEAVRLRPGRAALLWLGEAQLAAHDRAGAEATARRVLELLPGDEHALSLLERLEDAKSPGKPATQGGAG